MWARRFAALLLQAIQTLVDLRGNTNPVSIPEDEKLWIMIE
jgi:hypothetical protein